MQNLTLYDVIRWGTVLSGLSAFFYTFMLMFTLEPTPAILTAISLCLTMLFIFGVLWGAFDFARARNKSKTLTNPVPEKL
jgi:hypothetical protein